MFSEKEKFISTVMRLLDFLALVVAFPVAYFFDEFVRITANLTVKAYAIGPTIEGFVYFSSKYWTLLIGYPVIWVSIFYLNGVYKNFRTRQFKKFAWLIITSGFWAILASGSYLFLLRLELASRLFFLVYAWCALVLVITEKYFILKFLYLVHKRGYNQENLLIVGTGKRARDFIKAVKEHRNWGLNIIGLIDDEHGLYGKEIEGYRVIGRIQDIAFIVNRIVIDRVIFVVPRLWLSWPANRSACPLPFPSIYITCISPEPTRPISTVSLFWNSKHSMQKSGSYLSSASLISWCPVQRCFFSHL
jgi:hypothetical protein